MQNQSFFQERVGQVVEFINPAGRTNSVTVTQSNINELFKLQSKGYVFKAPVRIHRVSISDDTCLSCQA